MANTDKYSAQTVQSARTLTNEEIKNLLSEIKPGSKISNTQLCNYFAATLENKNARFNTNDKITIPVNTIFNNKPIETTIGRYIFNAFCLPEAYIKKHGYLNDPLTKKVLGSIENNFAVMLFEKEIDINDYITYVDKTEWLGMSLTKYITPSLPYEFLKPIKKVIDKRDKLFDQYHDELKDGNTNVIEKIEKELLSDAESEISAKNIPAYSFFKSGEYKMQDYKKGSILGGAFKDVNTGKLKLLKSNYMDGVSKEEYVDFSQYTVIGAYSRGVATQIYGALTKVINTGMQNTITDFDVNSDCGTKAYLTVKLEPKLKSMYKYRYIVENGKNVLLTPNNIDSYLNKEVNLRSPMLCKADKLCCKCCGELYHRTNVENPQLMCSSMSGSLLNKSMKKFHDTSTKFTRIDYRNFTHKF